MPKRPKKGSFAGIAILALAVCGMCLNKLGLSEKRPSEPLAFDDTDLITDVSVLRYAQVPESERHVQHEPDNPERTFYVKFTLRRQPFLRAYLVQSCGRLNIEACTVEEHEGRVREYMAKDCSYMFGKYAPGAILLQDAVSTALGDPRIRHQVTCVGDEFTVGPISGEPRWLLLKYGGHKYHLPEPAPATPAPVKTLPEQASGTSTSSARSTLRRK